LHGAGLMKSSRFASMALRGALCRIEAVEAVGKRPGPQAVRCDSRRHLNA
jgi:hypothetical protein